MSKLEEVLLRYWNQNLTFNQQLADRINIFRISWGAKDDDYIDWLGSGLTGVYPIRFSSQDEAEFFNSLLGLDMDSLQQDLYRVNGIEKSFKVSSNAGNIVCIYLAKGFLLSKEISKEHKVLALRSLYHILAYKILGSVFSHSFRHNVDPRIAQTVFESLSDKFLIKKLGNWEKTLDHMSSLIQEGSVQYKNIIDFEALGIVKVINDIQTRLRNMVVGLARVTYGFINSEDKNNKILNTSLVGTNPDDEDVMKDIITVSSAYIEFLRSCLISPNDFVQDDYVRVVCKVMGNVKEQHLRDALYYISINHSIIKTDEVDFVGVIIKQSMAFLQARDISHGYAKRALECLYILKKFFSASKVRLEELFATKASLSRMVDNALSNHKGYHTASVVIGVILYIFLRTISKGK